MILTQDRVEKLEDFSVSEADAKAKLRALATFADSYGDQFVRIQSISKAPDGTLRVLDMLDENVRKAARTFEGGKVSTLYTSDHSSPYK